MTYLQLAYLHLASVVPAFLIGTYLLVRRKGTPAHRMLGRMFMALMLFTACVSLFMEARVGPTVFNHFGFIHIFSALVLYSVPRAFFAIRANDIMAHRNNLIGVYAGGLVIAGSFALLPGRLIYETLFG